MGKRIIISESEKKNILSLYEQDSNEFKKENDFLKRYIGKTFISYIDPNFQTLPFNGKIDNITYDDVIKINVGYNVFEFSCLYNPSRIGYKAYIYDNKDRYNKTLIDDINQKGTASGIKWCQKPKSDFGTKSVNEDVKTTVPPPSESVLVVNKNPFKYSEFENARKVYSPELKDGELFYDVNKFKYENKITDEFNINFIKDLHNKTARYNDNIYKFLPLNTNESVNFGGYHPRQIGEIKMQINDGNVKDYIVYKSGTSEKSFIIVFNEIWIPSIQELYNKKYNETISPKLKIEYIPDEYFEIRKIQRETTDF